MAVTNEYSTEYTAANITTPNERLEPNEFGGKVRIAQFTHTQSAAGDAGSDVLLCHLPSGRIRVLGVASQAYVNWTTAAAKLDIGWGAYTDIDGTSVAADPDGIDDGINVETAGFKSFGTALTATGGSKVFESKDGVDIYATSTDTAIASGDTINGYIMYVADA